MEQNSALRNQSGFTIVEIILAILVGGIIVSSISQIVIAHTYLSQRGRDLIMANAYAEKKVEDLRSAGFRALSNGTTDIASELPAELSSPRSGSVVISSYSSAIKQVDVSITYNEQGTARTYTYRTYIGELGVGQY